MIIEKVLNNNTIVTTEPKTNKEVILVGCGIAFNKRIGQEVDENKIEKTFTIENKRVGNKLKEIINQIPDWIFELSHVIINHAIKVLNRDFDKQVYISLSDYIAFAIKRYKKNILIKNYFLDELRIIYNDEYKVALWGIKFINDKLNINLPKDEAVFITLHLVNASNSNSSKKSLEKTNIIEGILNIVRDYYSVEFNEDDLNYDRLLTHIKFFVNRIFTGNQHGEDDRMILDIAEKNYIEAFYCALKVKEYIENNYNYVIIDYELFYLTIHIHKVISILRDEFKCV